MPSAPRSSPAAPLASPVWNRWLPIWHGLFYAALMASTVVLLIGSAYSWWQYLLIIGLSLALGIWYGWMARKTPNYWRARPLASISVLAIEWGCWFILVLLFPIYLFLLCGLYPQAYIMLRLPWNIVAGFILTLLTIIGQAVAGGGWDWWLLIPFGAGLAGILIAVFIEAIAQQSEQRRQLISELQAAQQELAVAERQAGMLEERARLAREIHDTFAQAFTSLMMQLEAIEATPHVEVGTLQPQFKQMRRVAQEHLAEARRVMWALQPEVLDQASLPEALARLAQRVAEESQLAVTATTTGTACALRPQLEVTLLRAAQEALTNIQKHARASQVTITLSYMEDVVVVDVQDNGIGFEPDKLLTPPLGQATGGYGLKALQERAAQLGGTLSIESSPGAGTTIAVALPVRPGQPSLASRSARAQEVR